MGLNKKEIQEKLIFYWHSTKGWAPLHDISYWYRLVKLLKKGEPLREWRNGKVCKTGREPLAEIDDIIDFVNKSPQGNTIGFKETVTMLDNRM